MAGDWIKMRVDLAEDPAVIGIAARLSLDEFAVVGRLQALWSWADGQSRDGHAPNVTTSWINRKLQCDGFAEAMVAVHWLIVHEQGGVTFPNFQNHNGETAKTRALGKNRKQKQRSSADGHEPVTEESHETSRNKRDKNVTREEKRREEINTSTDVEVLLPFPKCKDLKGIDFSQWASLPDQETMAQWMKIRKAKKATNSQIAMDAVRSEIEVADMYDITADLCILWAVEKQWMGFKWAWVEKQIREEGRLPGEFPSTGFEITSKYHAAVAAMDRARQQQTATQHQEATSHAASV